MFTSAPKQASFDDLGTPLSQVTFVVLDLETTGASPNDCAITEVGAVKYRGGELLGRFETLVNPGVPIPPFITVLTGITESMLIPAPRIEEVLPPLLEFIGGAVVVGHNIRFDISFLDAALRAHGYPRLDQRRVDTIGLARRLLRDEVPDLKLGTLARHLRVSVSPCHRAFADAAATAEVLHALLERAGTFGVLGLDDLLALPTMRAHPSASKLRLTARLPRTPGVYLMKDRGGRVLYVGKATNLRSRVRSYFSGDTRRKVPQLLREVEAIDWIECSHELEVAVRELRLIQSLEPRFNRQGKRWRATAYVKLTLTERLPRLAVVRAAKADGNLYLGPFASTRAAQTVREAIETAAPLRRCNTRVGRRAVLTADAPCAPAQLGVACCPCRGHTPEAEYATVVDEVRRGLTGEPGLLLGPLERRMQALAEQERYEEAALTRDRLAALTRVLRRQQTLTWLSSSGAMNVAVADGIVSFLDGRLALGDPQLELDGTAVTGPPSIADDAVPAHLDRRRADELLIVARWLDREIGAGRARLLEVSGRPASPRDGALPRYEPVSRRGIRRGR
ncbi:MAG: DEDD exonuclease domain-containing protein [Acidimicrobiia bacterium]